MSEHVVPRDVRWRGWFLLLYVLGALVWATQVLRGWRHDRAHQALVELSVHHANMMRSGGLPSAPRDRRERKVQ